MTTHRPDISLTGSDPVLTDGGLETAIIFLEGIELPHFAAFPLVDREDGRAALIRYYEGFLHLAAERSLGFVLDTPTWRASPDWAPKLGYDLAGLARVNRDSVAFVAALRDVWAGRVSPILLSGAVGPRGDGYKNGTMNAAEAEDYHSFQMESFAGTNVDLVSVVTMNTIGEAIGAARAAQAHELPHVISFTVETDGRLVGGASLREAIEATEEATEGSAMHYMVNCAHPTHFDGALASGEAWVQRIGAIRANASRMSHAELDESPTLDAGDPLDLAKRYAALRQALPSIRVLGGCCGTDHRHIEAIRDACLPA